MVHDLASKVNHCLMAPLPFDKMDLPGEHSVGAGGRDTSGTQRITNKGKTNERCLHVQHYL